MDRLHEVPAQGVAARADEVHAHALAPGRGAAARLGRPRVAPGDVVDLVSVEGHPGGADQRDADPGIRARGVRAVTLRPVAADEAPHVVAGDQPAGAPVQDDLAQVGGAHGAGQDQVGDGDSAGAVQVDHDLSHHAVRAVDRVVVAAGVEVEAGLRARSAGRSASASPGLEPEDRVAEQPVAGGPPQADADRVSAAPAGGAPVEPPRAAADPLRPGVAPDVVVAQHHAPRRAQVDADGRPRVRRGQPDRVPPAKPARPRVTSAEAHDRHVLHPRARRPGHDDTDRLAAQPGHDAAVAQLPDPTPTGGDAFDARAPDPGGGALDPDADRALTTSARLARVGAQDVEDARVPETAAARTAQPDALVEARGVHVDAGHGREVARDLEHRRRRLGGRDQHGAVPALYEHAGGRERPEQGVVARPHVHDEAAPVLGRVLDGAVDRGVRRVVGAGPHVVVPVDRVDVYARWRRLGLTAVARVPVGVPMGLVALDEAGAEVARDGRGPVGVACLVAAAAVQGVGVEVEGLVDRAVAVVVLLVARLLPLDVPAAADVGAAQPGTVGVAFVCAEPARADAGADPAEVEALLDVAVAVVVEQVAEGRGGCEHPGRVGAAVARVSAPVVVRVGLVGVAHVEAVVVVVGHPVVVAVRRLDGHVGRLVGERTIRRGVGCGPVGCGAVGPDRVRAAIQAGRVHRARRVRRPAIPHPAGVRRSRKVRAGREPQHDETRTSHGTPRHDASA